MAERNCSIVGEAGWGRGWQTAAAQTSAIAPSYRFPHEGLPYHPGPERSPFFSHPRDTLPSFPPPTLPSPPSPLLSYPPSATSHNIHPRGRGEGIQGIGAGVWGASKIPSVTNTQTLRVYINVCLCVYAPVCTLNLPKQFFQCNWAWGTCVHEIAQPLLHASCSGVYVPLLALQRRQLPNHILTGVFERLLSTGRERERDRARKNSYEREKEE